MISRYRHVHLSRSLIFFSLFLIALLTGCSSGITSTPPVTTPTATPNLDGSPKGPGPAGLTATAQTTPVSTNCSIFNAAPAATSGWNTYTDSRFSFHVAIPPGWRAGSYVDGSGSDYIVFFFPPGDTTPVGDAGLGDPEHFEIGTTLVGTLSSPAQDTADWQVEKTKITIDGTPTAMYDHVSPDCGQVSHRSDNVTFGQHEFSFYMVSTPTKAKNNFALFLGMVESFA